MFFCYLIFILNYNCLYKYQNESETALLVGDKLGLDLHVFVSECLREDSDIYEGFCLRSLVQTTLRGKN